MSVLLFYCYSDSIFIPSNLFFVRTLYFKVYVAIPFTIASWISMISFEISFSFARFIERYRQGAVACSDLPEIVISFRSIF